jgi:hypothetical protein
MLCEFVLEETRMKIVFGFVAAAALATAASGDLLWDNYDTDGSNGYSMADVGAFGAQRALMDDFQVPDGGWSVTDFHALMLWNSGAVGAGWDFYLEFRPDVGGQPDPNPGIVTTGHVYGEVATGRSWFSRAEVEVSLDFDAVSLAAGTYWWYGYVVGPENAFMMIRADYLLNPCWLDYDDLGGFQSGFTQFGVDADLAFQITGVIPAPGALALLGLAGLARRRRR